MGEPVSILVVDDEPIVRSSLEHWFRDEGCFVDSAADAKEALRKLDAADWDIFLLDVRMPGMDGLDLQRRIRDVRPDAAVIVMTAYASVDGAVRAMKQGAHEYVAKPFDPEGLYAMVRAAVDQRRRSTAPGQVPAAAEPERFPGIVGESRAMRTVMEQVDRAGPLESPVLIVGEPGVGKELVARALHARSPRKYMPIIAARCGAAPADDMAIDLFGAERDAATGGWSRRGKLELADGGTIYLDAVGALEPKIGAALLDAMAERRIRRVGGAELLPADCRIVGSWDRDPEPGAAGGLPERLAVCTIRVPPLRDRREDVPILARRFLDEFTRTPGRGLDGFSPEALQRIEQYDWPGNVRELRNVVERAVVARAEGRILPEDLRLVGRGRRQPFTGGRRLAEVEKEEIERTLRETGWNISRSARLLGIDRVTLYNRIGKHGIPRP
ncbi:MAG: sigma-54 dependent transcriptional regulator [Myxococcota bacterium]|nr:sigma-54 dependent transcriptional regulator [Myxococcota bacterium]